MRDGLRMWTLYQAPKDVPDAAYVARMFIADASGARATEEVMCFETLERASAELERRGFVPMGRSPEDDPIIVGTWL